MDKWTELRTAYEVAKHGTVSAAADVLGIHRATVNRHIDVLEEELGARIFIRHARGYKLTELGEEALRVAQKTSDLIEDLAGRVKGKTADLTGEIKVTLLPILMKSVVTPVARFRRKHPNCRVTVIASEALERLEYGDAHVAIRVGRKPDQPDYVVTPYASFGLNLYAHDQYIKRHGLPVGEDPFRGHVFALPIGNEERLPFASWIAENVSPSQVALASNHPAVLSEAVMSGLGLGFLSLLDAAGRPDLHAVLPVNDDWAIPVWLVTHVDLHRTEKVQAMLRCLKAGHA